MTELVALLEQELPELVPIMRQGPTRRQIPRLVNELHWLAKCWPCDADDDSLMRDLETLQVAADWLEQVVAAGFGARAFLSKHPPDKVA